MTLPVGPLSPYVSPEMVLQAPTGVDFTSIPPGRLIPASQRTAELSNICQRATALVDEACAQPLRATTDSVILYGPGVRVGAPRNCGTEPARLILKRWPVLEIVSVQVAQNTLPAVWTTVPAGNYAVENPVSGLYGSVAPTAAAEGGQGILVSSQYVNWAYGANGLAIDVEYINGWPHAGLTAAAAEGDTALTVDDCTGWAVTSPLTGYAGATGTVYDAGAQEVVHVTAASATAGPGTLTLAAPLQSAHAAGVLVSSLPQSVVWAAILFCASQALTRGATSTTVREVPGARQEGGGGASDLAKQACALLAPFKRII